MIGRLQGKLIVKTPPQLLIDCHGVGYEVEVPMTTIWALPELGETATLLTHLVVRDDAHLLFGFATEAERTLFRSLLKVSGIGAKVAFYSVRHRDGRFCSLREYRRQCSINRFAGHW